MGGRHASLLQVGEGLLQAGHGLLDAGARRGDVEAQEAFAALAEGDAAARGDAGVALDAGGELVGPMPVPAKSTQAR